MRYTDEQKKGMASIYEKIKGIRMAMLTTVDRGTQRLHSRPMATHETDQDGTLWFFTFGNSEKADEVRCNDNVNLNYADPGRELYVSVSGSAEIVEDKEKIKALWKPFLKAWFPEGENTPDLALLKVNILEAEYWDAHSNRMVKLFHMAKAIFTGVRDTDAEHDKVKLGKV